MSILPVAPLTLILWLCKKTKMCHAMNLLPTRLNKGVIVYICDSRGVRDIYDTDGSNVVAASEPLAVLVSLVRKLFSHV